MPGLGRRWSGQPTWALGTVAFIAGIRPALAAPSAPKAEPVPASTEAALLPGKRYTLEEFIRAAENSGSALAEQNAQILFAEARLSLARAKAFPSGKVDLFLGPTPGAAGNALDGATERDRWGAASGIKADLTQPIYTFGALGAARDAAEAGVQAEKQLLERDRWKLRTQIQEFYYGYQLAFELTGVTEDMRKKLEDALDKGEDQRRHNRRGGPTAADLDKLRVYLDEVKVRESEANKGLEQARAAMAWKIGTYGQEIPKWDRANLEPRQVNVPSLAEVQKFAAEMRPELKAMQLEVKARRSLITTERAQFLPTLFVGASFSYTSASVRQNQQSPFAYDPLNDLSGGVFAGLRWNLGFFERNAQVSMARAESIKAEGRLRHLGQGIFVEIEKYYTDFMHEQASVALRKDASQASKRVYTDAGVAFSIGTGKAQNLLESVGSFALAEKARFENIYNHNLAAARLEQAVGRSFSAAEPIATPAASAK